MLLEGLIVVRSELYYHELFHRCELSITAIFLYYTTYYIADTPCTNTHRQVKFDGSILARALNYSFEFLAKEVNLIRSINKLCFI